MVALDGLRRTLKQNTVKTDTLCPHANMARPIGTQNGVRATLKQVLHRILERKSSVAYTLSKSQLRTSARGKTERSKWRGGNWAEGGEVRVLHTYESFGCSVARKYYDRRAQVKCLIHEIATLKSESRGRWQGGNCVQTMSFPFLCDSRRSHRIPSPPNNLDRSAVRVLH